MKWVYLLIAIVGELIATTALKESNGFSDVKASLIVVIGYGVTFYFLALAIKEIPMGVAYAIWAGVGIILVCIIGLIRFKQVLDLPAIIGICLIIVGVCIINMYSTMTH